MYTVENQALNLARHLAKNKTQLVAAELATYFCWHGSDAYKHTIDLTPTKVNWYGLVVPTDVVEGLQVQNRQRISRDYDDGVEDAENADFDAILASWAHWPVFYELFTSAIIGEVDNDIQLDEDKKYWYPADITTISVDHEILSALIAEYDASGLPMLVFGNIDTRRVKSIL